MKQHTTKRSLIMPRTIATLHEEILDFLLIKREENPNLKFVLRSKNNSKRLEKGYWFLGSKSVVISFWHGRDWKNKTANIYLEIWQNGETSIVFSAKDSKTKAIELEKLAYKLQLNQIEKRKGGKYPIWYKTYSKNNFIANIDFFLNTDKEIIDNYIVENKISEISIIAETTFLTSLKKIEPFRRERQKKQKEITIKKIEISNIKCFKDISLHFNKNQNIILAENGKGKSTILQLLAFAIKKIEYPPNQWNDIIRKGENKAEFQITLIKNDIEEVLQFGIDENNKIILPEQQSEILLFAYGAARSAKIENSNIDIIKKTADISTLVGINQFHINYDDYLRDNKDFDHLKTIINEIFNYNDNALNVELKEYKNKTFYFSSPSVSNKSNLSLETMSDGFRTTFLWIVDFLTRLYFNNIYVTNAEEIFAIVLIDEIDLHLHPKWQRTIMPALAKTFPNVQFIVTTHSPYIAQSVGIENITKLISEKNTIIVDNEIAEITSELSIESYAKEVYGVESIYSISVQKELSDLEELRLQIIETGKIANKKEFLKLANTISGKGEELSTVVQRTLTSIHYQTDIEIEL